MTTRKFILLTKLVLQSKLFVILLNWRSQSYVDDLNSLTCRFDVFVKNFTFLVEIETNFQSLIHQFVVVSLIASSSIRTNVNWFFKKSKRIWICSFRLSRSDEFFNTKTFIVAWSYQSSFWMTCITKNAWFSSLNISIEIKKNDVSSFSSTRSSFKTMIIANDELLVARERNYIVTVLNRSSRNLLSVWFTILLHIIAKNRWLNEIIKIERKSTSSLIVNTYCL